MKPEYLELYKKIIGELSKDSHFRINSDDYYDEDVLSNPDEKNTAELGDKEFFDRLSFLHLSEKDQGYYQYIIGNKFLEALRKVKGLTFSPTTLSLQEVFDLTPEEITRINQQYEIKGPEITDDVAYQYNPHSQVKIWLSGTSTLFMTERNQNRLLETRKQNPDLELHLVYDSQLLNDREKLRVRNFCYQHKFSPFDIRQVINNPDKFQLTEKERKLLTLYAEEINNLDNGGNLAAASDILRWISPVYTLGSYCDLDVSINTALLPKTVSVSSPLLLNVGHELRYCDNATIAIIDKEAAESDISCIQIMIIERCSGQGNQPESLLKFYHPWESAVLLRQNILDSTKDNASFLALLGRNALDTLNLFGRHLSYITSLPTEDLSEMRLKFREDALFEAVMYTTGPNILMHFMVEKGNHDLPSIDSYADRIGFCGYKELQKAYEYHPAESDLSWFEQAQKEIRQENATKTIQRSYRTFKEKFNDSIIEDESTNQKTDNKPSK